MNHAWSVGPIEIELTSVSDGNSHLITVQAFAAGVSAGHGRYQATCGTEVIATSMTTSPGPRCRQCLHVPASNPVRSRPSGQRRASPWSMVRRSPWP